jgi:cytoskeleton protein RodZ
VELEIRQESWLQLSSDGTSVVEGEVLPAGTSRRYTAANAMDLRIGNAAGVQLRVNGESVPSLGGEGQVRFLTITPDTSAASLAASR